MEAVTRILSERFVLDLVVKGVLLMTLAFAITFVLRRASAALRHATWSLAFVGLLLLPIGAVLLPTWQVSLPPLGAVDGLRLERSSSDGQPAHVKTQPALDNESVAAETDGSGVFVRSGTVSLPMAAHATNPLASASRDVTWSWTTLALLLWISVAILLFIRLSVVLGKLSLLRRSAKPVTDPILTELAEILLEALDVRRPVLLLQHEEIVVPMTYGVRRPVIFLPPHADGWSEDQKQVTLMHEMLHIQRFDHLVHVLALSARAIHWFNPLTWVATKRLVAERERACDDGVLAMGVASTSYADHLLGMARYVLSGKEASVGALAMARPSELRSRIVAILNPGQPRHAMTRLRALGMTGCAMISILLLAAMQPTSETRKVPSGPAIQSDNDGPGAEPWSRQAIAGREAEDDIDALDEVDSEQDFISEDDVYPEHDFISEDDVYPEHDIHPDDPSEVIVFSTAAEQRQDTTDVESQRRAIHAISQLPQERSTPLLREIAETHSNTELREEAVFWLGQVGDGSTAELLESFARNDPSPDVQKRAVFALAEIENAGGIPRLIDLAKTHPNSDIQAEAVFWLGQQGGSEMAGILADFARTGASRSVQEKAIFALSQIDGEEGVPHLIDLAKTHSDLDLRSEAIFWLGETGDPRAADVLMEIVNGR